MNSGTAIDVVPHRARIERADLTRDRSRLLEGLNRWLPQSCSEERFDWLYLKNPHGQAIAWMAVEQGSGQLLGGGAAFPRRMRSGNATKRACVLGDFFIRPEFRTLGPAVQLQRALESSLEREAIDACYDFPAAGMLPVYKRMGRKPSGSIVRLAKLLLSDSQIEKRLKLGHAAHLISSVINSGLRLADAKRSHASNIQIHPLADLCGEEFSDLAGRVSGGYGWCTERSAEYLNWRFKDHYSRLYSFLVARDPGGRLLGYLVWFQDTGTAEIVDLLVSETEVLSALVMRLVKDLRQRCVGALSISLLANHPWVEVLESLGFFKRESHPLVIWSARCEAVNVDSWFLLNGDRES